MYFTDGEDQKDMHIPGVYFREFLPSTQEVTIQLTKHFSYIVTLYTYDSNVNIVGSNNVAF